MKDLAQATSIAQIIRCAIGDLSFGIDKADVLSIQRTERIVLRGAPGSPDLHALADRLENPDRVMGWLSDGVRQIPVIRLSPGTQTSFPDPDSGNSLLDESARVILFAPISAVGGQPGQISSPPWGLLVDRVEGTIEASRNHFHSAPWMLRDATLPVFRSVVRIADQVLLLLDARSANPYRDAKKGDDGASHPVLIENDPISKGPLAQTAGKQNGPPRGEPASRGLVVFPVWEMPGERRISLGLSISQVPEILEAAVVIPAPAGPDYVRELVFWRETPIPVIDIAARMGIQPVNEIASSPARRFIITRHRYPPQVNPERASLVYAAIEVRSAVRILRLPIESQPSTRSLPVDPGMVLGQVELQDETLVIPDLKTVLSQDIG